MLGQTSVCVTPAAARSPMKFVGAVALAGSIALGLSGLATSPVIAAGAASHTDIAKYLAGIAPPSGSALFGLTKSRGWKSHAKTLNKSWAKIEKRQLSKIRAWSKQHITTPNKSMLYMFSGPDYLYANTFFPDATSYVFAGLEPVGSEPSLLKMSKGTRSRGIANLRASLNHIVRLSYFITEDMSKKLHGKGFRGTVPILYVFLARANKTIESISFVKLNKDGTLKVVDKAPRGRPSGVKIVFTDAGGTVKKSLYYFSINLKNSGLKKNGFLKFMDALGPADSFFKSASYLPHYGSFKVIRNFILKRSQRIVQDDTGFKLSHYDMKKWNVEPYGNYSKPIPVFAARYQPAMKRFFRKRKSPKLTFGIGYRFRPATTSMLLATKK